MFSKWFLVLFILTILFLIFVLGYHIYYYFEIQNCKTISECSETRNILFWLDIVSLILLIILIFGFFFARDKKCEQMELFESMAQTQQKIQQKINQQQPNIYPQRLPMNNNYPPSFTSPPSSLYEPLTESSSINPFSYSSNDIDIISRV
jgi:hypothetical protein